MDYINAVKQLRRAHTQVKVGALYYHYKNPRKYYRVKDLAISEDDHKIIVVYSSYGNSDEITWVRPLESWLEYVNETPRFSRLE